MAVDTNGIVRASYAHHGDRLYKWGGTPVGHTLVKPNGWEYDFQRTTSPRYRLVRARDGQGKTWTVSYYANGKLKRIENDFGRWLEIDYATTNDTLCISGVRSSDGREVLYEYDLWTDAGISNNILAGVHYPDGSQATYTYVGAQSETTGRPLLATANDPLQPGAGARVKYVYNYDASFDFGNGEYLVTGTVLEERNLDTDEIVVRMPFGAGDFPYILLGNGTELIQKYTNGLLIEKRDGEGRPIHYSRDQGGLGYISGVTDGFSNTTSYVRDYAGRILQEVDPLGYTNSMAYNEAGFITSRVDKLGQATVFTRDTNNLLIRVDYPNGSAEEWTYNSFGQVLSHIQGNGGTNVYEYYDGMESGGMLGDLKSRTDPEGNITIYTWSNSGQLVSVLDQLSNVTRFAYNWRGLLLAQTNANLAVTRYQYDVYANRTNVIDALGHETTYTYDEFNRMTAVRDALNRVTAYEYGHSPGGCSGCGSASTVSRITDPAGRVVENFYDLSDKLTNRVIGAGTADAASTFWTYDLAGRKQTQTDDNGNLHVWVYDKRGRVIAETNAAGHVTEYAYDPVGNLTNRINGAGELTTWEYDTMNQMIAQGSGDLRYEYQYDLVGNRTAMYTRVDGVITETTAYAYDLNQRLTEKTDPVGFSLHYGYDAINNRTNLIVARIGGSEVLKQTYRYNSLYNVIEIEANGRSSFFGYDDMGRRTNAVWPNGTTATYTYDAAHQLLSLVHGRANPSGEPLASFTYGYDLSGNRTNMITLEGENRYAYDTRNWLIEAEYPDGLKEEFTYDGVGNRLTLTETTTSTPPVLITTYTYGSANRLLSSVSAVETNEYLYDAAGRLTNHLVNGAGRTFAYNFRSQMTRLADVNETEFAYDFDGVANRISQSLNDCLTSRFVYDGLNIVLDLNATGQITEVYVHFPGIDQPIERISFINDEPRQRQVYHQDGLGSVAALTDDGENIVKSYTYRAFGRIRTETGLGLNRYTFTARESIGDTQDLMYYRYRVLSPRTGRFTSFDPLGFVDGANKNIYVINSPINYTDPYGLMGRRPTKPPVKLPPGWGWSKPSDEISESEWKSLVRDYQAHCDDCPETKPSVDPQIFCLEICNAFFGSIGGSWVATCQMHCESCNFTDPFKDD